MWLFLCALMVVNLIWVALSPRLSLSWGAVGPMLLVAAGVPLALIYRELRGRDMDRLLEALFRMLMVALFAGLLTQQVNLFSHLMMTLGRPLADPLLLAWDEALGFDWNRYAAFMTAHTWSRALLYVSYLDLIQPALLVIVFSALWFRRYDRVEEVAFLALVSGFICVFIAGLMPAVAAWSSVATPETLALLRQPALHWGDQFQRLRGDGPVVFSLGEMEGLATFPSYHACLAIIVMWCSRGRWFTALPGVVAGLAILAATPIYGAHYGIDLLGGAGVMAVSILLWRRVGPALQKGGARP